MTQEIKVMAGIGLATVAIMVGGIFLLSKSGPGDIPAADRKVLLRDKKHSIDGKDAKVTLVEFADFQCPACSAAHPVIREILRKYEGRLTFVYRHFPLPQHKNAKMAARAAEAAGEQGKFWGMYDLLFEKQIEWSEVLDPTSLFVSYAKTLGLDTVAFEKSVSSNRFDQAIADDAADGADLGVNSTPTFFLNGKKLELRSFGELSDLVGQAVKNQK